MNKTISLLLISSLAGCAQHVQSPLPQRMIFPEAEYHALPKSGTSTVKGQAFLKTRAGDVKTAAGNQVLLNPVTSYSIDWYENSYLSNRRFENPDPRLAAYIPIQIADGNGRFTFKNVPAGDYYVTTSVTWEAPTGYQGGLQTQGGLVSKRIKVGAGEEIEIIITK